MEITREIEFNLLTIVYLKTDRDQLPRMLTGVLVKPHTVLYELVLGSETSFHEGYEISATVDMVMKLNSI
jgi:hypothetical protein